MSSFQASSSSSSSSSSSFTAQIDRTEKIIGLMRAMSRTETIKCFKVLQSYWTAYVCDEIEVAEPEYDGDCESEFGDDEDCESEVGNDTIECYYDDSPLLTDISLDEIDQVLLKDHDEEEFIERIKDVMDVSFELEPLVLPVKVEPVGIEVEFTPSPAPIVAPVATAIVDIKPTKIIAKQTSIAPPKTTTIAVIASASKRASLKLPIITPSTVVKPPTTRGNRMSLAPAPTTAKSSTAKSAVSAAISAVKVTVPTKARTPLQSITAPNTKSIRAPVFKTKTKTPTLPAIVEAPKVKTTMKNRVSLAPGTRAERFASVNTHTGPVF